MKTPTKINETAEVQLSPGSMSALSPIIYAFCRGLKDSIIGTVTVFTLDKNIAAKANQQLTPQKEPSQANARRRHREGTRKSSTVGEPNVLKRTLQCCALNGGLCWLSKMFFDHCVVPFLYIIVGKVFGDSSTRFLVWSWLETVVDLVFSTFWIIPIFVLSKILNSLWFQDIADSAYHYSRGRPQKMASLSRFVADSLFNVVVQALFLVQTFLVSLVPLAMLSQLLTTVHMCLLYSLYAFEYKWTNMGWELHHRLTFIEENWPYFLGFGLPLTLLTSLSASILTSGCLFSILFPLFIISGNDAEPVIGACDYSLQLFSPVVSLSNTMFSRSLRTLRQ